MPTAMAMELDAKLRWPENVAALANECRDYDRHELGQHSWLVDYWAYWGARMQRGEYMTATEQRDIVRSMRAFAEPHCAEDLVENLRHDGVVTMTQLFNRQLLGMPVEEPTAGEILRPALAS